jgi:hypothetical protein
MPRGYYDYYESPGGEAFGDFGKGFRNSFESGIERALNRKDKLKDVETELATKGYRKAKPEDKIDEDTPSIELFGETYIKPYTPMEMAQKEYDKREREQKYLAGNADIDYTKAQTEMLRQKPDLMRAATEIKAIPKPPPVNRAMQSAMAKAQANLAETNSFVKTEIPTLIEMKKLNANSYGGFGGDIAFKTKSALNMGQDDPKFQNTAMVINTMQGMVAKILKSTFGGQLSEGEREYLNKVMGALPKLSQVERDIAIDRVIRTIQENAAKAQSKYEELQGYGLEQPQEDIDPLGIR